MKIAVLVLFMYAASASAQWSDRLHAVTSGNFDDINPQMDHAGMAAGIIGGFYGSSLKAEWLVFERWSGGSDAIAAVKFSGSSLEWDSTVSIISPAVPGAVQKYPDVCTAGSGRSLAAWQVRSDGAWNIEYSTGSIDSSEWSVPAALTNDSVSNIDVEVRPLSDSSFVLIWRRGSSILYSVYKSGSVSQIDSLVATNTDSTDYDFAGGSFVWTEMGSSGNRFCLMSKVGGLAPLSLSPPDTISTDGDMSDPLFVSYGGPLESSFTFDLRENGRYTVWLSSSLWSSGSAPEELAGDTGASYLHAVLYAPPYVTAVSTRLEKATQPLPGNFYAWEKRTALDTSVVFYIYSSGGDSIQQGCNPSMSSVTFFVGGKTSLGFVAWQSDRSGRSHIYSRDFLWTQDAIDEPTGPVTTFRLDQNYPNPFNPTTAISYQLSATSHVTLAVYDVLGRKVATLVDERQSEGSHTVVFDGSNYASGVYFYRLTAPGVNIVRKMLLEK